MPKAVKTPKTNAMRELESAGIPYVLHTYEDDDDESSGLGVAISEQLGEEPGQGFKTLVCTYAVQRPCRVLHSRCRRARPQGRRARRQAKSR